MVWYHYQKYLQQATYTADQPNPYDSLDNPGDITPHSGIYRCESCGCEIVSETSRPFPPTHANAAQGHKIQWRLVAFPNPPPTQ
jgi:hypothetical protein